MIGKVMIGKSFKGCIPYCMEDKKMKQSDNVTHINRAEVIMYNQCYGNTKELIQQFNETRQLNSKVSKPVLHITLSLAPGEKLEKEDLADMVTDCAKTFGFENNQFIAISHNDTNHQHVHIVANRIGFDGKAVSDSNSYKKIALYCRQVERQYNLQQVLSPKKFLPKELRHIPRTDARIEAIKIDVQNALRLSKTYAEFERYMKQKNYQVLKARGIAFVDEKGVYVKGSSLGYSLATIERILQKSSAEKQALLSQQQEKDGKFIGQVGSLAINPTRDLKKEIMTDLYKTADAILKPEINNENVPYPLLKKKKKRKNLSI